MSGTYKMITVVGTSPTSIDDAVRNAVGSAATTLRHLGWFEVAETRGRIEDGRVVEFQVKVHIGLKVEGEKA